MSWLEQHLLTIVIFLPVAGALVSLLLPEGEGGQHKGIALIVSLLTFFVSIPLWTGFHPAGKWAWEQKTEWAPSLGISYHVGLDGVALLLVMLTTFLGPIVVLSSWKFIQQRVKIYCISLLFLETAMLGTLGALDLVLFYVFWEAMLIPMYLLIGIWGGPRRIYASVKFIIYTIVGSVLMLAAILYVALQAGTFDVLTLQSRLPGAIPIDLQHWLFAAFAISFAIKVPLFPFHTWLPDAHVEAPTAGSVILAGVLLKMGTYGFLRFAIPFFPQAAADFTPTFIWLSTIGIIYGSLMAMAQSDIKKLVAYSSVAHLGFCMLGIFSGTQEGTQGAVLQMVNHGLSTGALFLLVGVIYEKTHRRGVDDFGGMARVMPVYATLFMIVTLSSIGLPGLNGFVGEFLVLFGSFRNHPIATAFASLGVVLGAVYMLKMYRDVFFGPVTRPEREKVGDVEKGDLVYLVPIVALIILLGVLPNLVLSKTEPAVKSVVERYTETRKVSVEHHR